MADKVEHNPPPNPPSLARSGKHLASFIGGSRRNLRPKHRTNDFMKYRRFAVLHHQSLRERHQKIDDQNPPLKSLPRIEEEGDHHFSARGPQRADLELQEWFPTKIGGPLRPFNSAILSCEALKWAPPPSPLDYKSNGEYLDLGPPVIMHFNEIPSDCWWSYEAAVEKLLQDRETAGWLSGPLDPNLGERAGVQVCYDWDGNRAKHTTWVFKAKRKFHRLVEASLLLFWVSHITAALALPLVAHHTTPKAKSGPEVNSFVICLLTYWYLSAVGIVVQGCQAKGFVYARKVFLGGIVTCFGGFYILYMLMRISAASSCAAIPSLFTIVLILIRTM